ncbi:apyrase [Ranunculus cassubicifolius]
MTPESRGTRWKSLSLSNFTREIGTSIKSWKGCIKFTLSLLLVVILLVSLYHVYKPEKTPSYFTVVVDCGSTGSRVNIYKWVKNGTTYEAHPILLQTFPEQLHKGRDQDDACQYHCMQTEPGLDMFVHNTSGVREAIEPLIRWAEQQIPRERHEDTSLFVLGTAGLRKLEAADVDWILGTVETVAKNHSFICRRNWIRVLSGQEEAYYGWVALNYKMGRLRNSDEEPTFGVLDMGGSSLQVVVEDDTVRDSNHIVRSKIGSVKHNILAYSLKEFGLNVAFDRSVVMLSEETPLTVNNNGCFHLNATDLGRKLNSKLSKNHSSSLNLVGDPDWERCMGLARAAAIRTSSTDLIQVIMDLGCRTQLPSSDSTELQNETVVPRKIARFHALSGFFAVYNVLKLNSKANLTTILMRGQELCSHLWSNTFKFPGNRKYVDQFCFNVPYLTSLIRDALCMGDTELIFGPGDVSWTLGAALVEGKSLRRSETIVQNDSSRTENKVVSSPVLFIILFSCLSFTIYLVQVTWNALRATSLPARKAPAVGVSLPSFISPKRQSN